MNPTPASCLLLQLVQRAKQWQGLEIGFESRCSVQVVRLTGRPDRRSPVQSRAPQRPHECQLAQTLDGRMQLMPRIAQIGAEPHESRHGQAEGEPAALRRRRERRRRELREAGAGLLSRMSSSRSSSSLT